MAALSDSVTVKSFGVVSCNSGGSRRTPYEHQKKAMECLDKIDREPDYSTLVVLPTGGGKTYTASVWLLKHAIDRKKKVLWIAHRQMLLDQAADSFIKYACPELTPHISSFSFRIVSGASGHDRTSDISPNDRLLIVSKDSIGRNLSRLDKWLQGEQEIYLVVDEAHHSTAKTYRKVIDYVRERVPHVKLIGLTATPFRTAESEQGLLARIYSDGLRDGVPVHGDVGIAYEISLRELINRRILAKPIFESCYTDERYGSGLGLDALESIQRLDMIPDDIASQMAENAERNNLIVRTYREKREQYGQTIVFAVNVVHAIQLAKLFNNAGIRADYIVSDVKDSVTGVTISRDDNERKLRAYQNGELQVLVNVNILTEGVDLPKTQSVFLARPTVSAVLMTQMVGRALRGPNAGGTSNAYIVSFIDHWNERIAWVNPESIFVGENEFADTQAERVKSVVRMIAISKIEEFASLLDETVDTVAFEMVPFEKRIPVGMYAFTYLEENGIDHSCQVMVYDNAIDAYKELMDALPSLFKSFSTGDEYLPEDVLEEMERQCRDTFFCCEMIPPYDPRDIVDILKYYAQYEATPQFYTFDEVDRSRLDVTAIVRRMIDANIDPRDEKTYLERVWNDADNNMLQLFFGGRKMYFMRQCNIERAKLAGYYDEVDERPHVIYGKRELEKLPLYRIREIDPELERSLRNGAFQRAKNERGEYKCARCGVTDKSRVFFQVDHIIPMNNGGRSVPENLQILCRKCNGEKGDR